MTPDEYRDVARDYAEHEVDALIDAERDPVARAALVRHREQIIDRLVAASVADDRRRRRDAERLRGPGASVH